MTKKTNLQVGVGLPKIWQLSAEHPFYRAAELHDAAYDALYVYQGKIKLEDLVGEEYPDKYKNLVEYSLQYLKDFIEDWGVTKGTKIFITDSDFRFRDGCYLVADTLWLKTQARIFYRLIQIYRSVRFTL